MLAVLLVAHGRPVAAERLVAEVWGEDAAGQTAAPLHVVVSRLRSLLEPDRSARSGTRLVSTAAGYSLRADSADVDTWDFEAHLETAGEANTRRADWPAARRPVRSGPACRTPAATLRRSAARPTASTSSTSRCRNSGREPCSISVGPTRRDSRWPRWSLDTRTARRCGRCWRSRSTSPRARPMPWPRSAPCVPPSPTGRLGSVSGGRVRTAVLAVAADRAAARRRRARAGRGRPVARAVVGRGTAGERCRSHGLRCRRTPGVGAPWAIHL